MALSHSPSIVTEGLVLCLDAANRKSYPGSGLTWGDISYISNNATLINGATFGFDNNGYIRCDGTDDYIEVLDSSSLDFGANNFTVEYWFRKLQSTSGGYDNVWGPNKWNLGSSTGTNEWTLGIGDGTFGNTNKYEFAIAATTNTIYGIQSSDQLLINTWYQLIGMRDGANLKLFLNGILKLNQNPSGMTAGTAVANVGRNLRINNSQTNNLYTNADSAICRIYNRALSDIEVLQNFNALRGRFGI